jgi:hypothetical protein
MSKYRIRNFVALAKKWLVELGWLILYGLIHDVDIIWVDIWCWYYMGWYSQWYMLTFIRWTFWCCYMGLCIKMGKWPHRPAFACSWFARSNQTNRSSWYSWNIRSVWLQAFPYNGTDHDGCRSVQNQSTQLMFFSPPRDWTWQHHMKKIEARQIFAFRERRNERQRMGYQDVAYTAAISLIHMQQRRSSSL